MDSKQILLEALRLPEAERAALAGELIESLDTEVDADAEAAWSTEIHRRVEELHAGRARTVPWAEARRRIRMAAQGGARS
jgi:putative addiction module component (TIGR02574 family)